MKKLNLNPLLGKLAEKRDRVMEFHRNNKPDCGMHNHKFDCFKDDVPEEWERVQRMRREGDPLVKGGQYREFDPPRDARITDIIKG
jgi:hypothetical protein